MSLRHSRCGPNSGQGAREFEPTLFVGVLLFRFAIAMDFLTIFPAPACFRRVLIGFAAALALSFSLAITPRGLSAPQKIKPPAEAEESYAEGMQALQRGDLSAAELAFEKVLRLLPNSAEAHNSLGWVLLAQEKTD